MQKRDEGPLGFGESMAHGHVGFGLSTNIICGTNALEHGVNLLEEQGVRNVLVVGGWNIARICPLMWEMEPRQFNITTFRLEQEATDAEIKSIAAAAQAHGAGAIFAVGGARVLDAAKAATDLLLPDDNDHNHHDHDDQIDTINSNRPIRLVTVPTVPSFGAEISRYASAHVVPKEYDEGHGSSDASTGSDEDKGSMILGGDELELADAFKAVDAEHSASTAAAAAAAAAASATVGDAVTHTLRLKQYRYVASPHMCLIQPSLFDRLPMEMAHDRIVGTMALCVDLILGDAGFIPELVAWDALSTLTSLLEVSFNTGAARAEAWAKDPASFTLRTVYDTKEKHQSQHFRRYGHGMGPQDILDLARASAAVGAAAAGAGGVDATATPRILPLHLIADTLDATCSNVPDGFMHRCAALLPVYLQALHEWSLEKTDETDAKGVTLFKLNRLARVLGSLRYTKMEKVTGDGERGDMDEVTDIADVLEGLSRMVHAPLVSLMPLEAQQARLVSTQGIHVSSRQVYKLRQALRELAPGSPAAQMDVDYLKRMLDTPPCPALTAGQGWSSPEEYLRAQERRKLDIEAEAGNAEDVGLLNQLNEYAESQQQANVEE